jgi:hypothetical protein
MFANLWPAACRFPFSCASSFLSVNTERRALVAPLCLTSLALHHTLPSRALQPLAPCFRAPPASSSVRQPGGARSELAKRHQKHDDAQLHLFLCSTSPIHHVLERHHGLEAEPSAVRHRQSLSLVAHRTKYHRSCLAASARAACCPRGLLPQPRLHAPCVVSVSSRTRAHAVVRPCTTPHTHARCCPFVSSPSIHQYGQLHSLKPPLMTAPLFNPLEKRLAHLLRRTPHLKPSSLHSSSNCTLSRPSMAATVSLSWRAAALSYSFLARSIKVTPEPCTLAAPFSSCLCKHRWPRHT